MQTENKHEYQMLRTEMQALKDCITNYMGFVIGGSGAALYGLASVARTRANAYGLSLAALALATLVTVVLAILFYKFNSHNRYAGYCKLLTHERFNVPGLGATDLGPDIHAWEVCMARLRDSDFHINVLTDADGLPELLGVEEQHLRERCEAFGGSKPTQDQENRRQGPVLFARTLLGRRGTRSWGFPLYVVAVFMSLTLLFLGVGLVIIQEQDGLIGQLTLPAWLLPTALLAVVTGLWLRFLAALVTLDSGSRSVEAFCWKFVQIRRRFLHEAYAIPFYRLIGVGSNEAPT